MCYPKFMGSAVYIGWECLRVLAGTGREKLPVNVKGAETV